eukprot:TRINITY_DN29572_c0_g1_i1.p1 TRINITY_DN29572_c0_g1~~TRINITY_DN29572_c0_g1_i1.p1  ORF type:complete len:445 (+),score=130.59 TRINITY_DN29572_c0_g1_i1:71-1336(+)
MCAPAALLAALAAGAATGRRPDLLQDGGGCGCSPQQACLGGLCFSCDALSCHAYSETGGVCACPVGSGVCAADGRCYSVDPASAALANTGGCGELDCGVNGAAAWSTELGRCWCRCYEGFAGERCGSCAAGRTNFPLCDGGGARVDETAPAAGGCAARPGSAWIGPLLDAAPTTDAADCCAFCGRLPGCAAWSWERHTRQCSLKSAISGEYRDPTTYSGRSYSSSIAAASAAEDDDAPPIWTIITIGCLGAVCVLAAAAAVHAFLRRCVAAQREGSEKQPAPPPPPSSPRGAASPSPPRGAPTDAERDQSSVRVGSPPPRSRGSTSTVQIEAADPWEVDVQPDGAAEDGIAELSELGDPSLPGLGSRGYDSLAAPVWHGGVDAGHGADGGGPSAAAPSRRTPPHNPCAAAFGPSFGSRTPW